MAYSFQVAKIRGIPIRAHITLVILLPAMAMSFAGGTGASALLFGTVMALGLLLSVALHELGHSLVAMAYGCRVRQILLLPIGGMAQMDRIPRLPREEVRVAIAGPLVSLALAGAGFMGFFLLTGLGQWNAGSTALALGALNLMLFLFNLLPSFPMDGGRIFRAWLTPRLGRLEATRIAAKIGRFIAVLFGLWGLFHGNLFLVLIAVFVFHVAGAEYRMVRMQEQPLPPPLFRPPAGPAGPRPLDDWEISVGPPPYGRSVPPPLVPPLKPRRSLFEELFRDWH